MKVCRIRKPCHIGPALVIHNNTIGSISAVSPEVGGILNLPIGRESHDKGVRSTTGERSLQCIDHGKVQRVCPSGHIGAVLIVDSDGSTHLMSRSAEDLMIHHC